MFNVKPLCASFELYGCVQSTAHICSMWTCLMHSLSATKLAILNFWKMAILFSWVRCFRSCCSACSGGNANQQHRGWFIMAVIELYFFFLYFNELNWRFLMNWMKLWCGGKGIDNNFEMNKWDHENHFFIQFFFFALPEMWLNLPYQRLEHTREQYVGLRAVHHSIRPNCLPEIDANLSNGKKENK